jgi:chromate transport protein ChrA
MYLAGTIIFGGGPVVIPLLKVYVVDPGWVSSRDFLLGLAIIQAFPGPNFSFAIYLGGLALQRFPFPTVFDAFFLWLLEGFPTWYHVGSCGAEFLASSSEQGVGD